MKSDFILIFTSILTSINFERTEPSSKCTICSSGPKRNFKLIQLYAKNECLWMETHKDYLNADLKETLWKQIAQEMVSKKHPHPQPEKWKNLLIKWRYNVQLFELHRHEAQIFNKLDELPNKLHYSDRIQFLITHMFDRKKPTTEALKKPPQSSVAQELSLLKRLNCNKNQPETTFRSKLQALERMRNKRRDTMKLSPEAFRRLP